MQLTVNSEVSLQHAIGELRELYKANRFLSIAVKES